MPVECGKVTPEVIKELIAILGADAVSTRENEIKEYSHDETPLVKHYPPQVIVRPKDVIGIVRLLQFANGKRLPVTPRGAGTGVSGGAIPIHGGIVLSLTGLNRILEIDRENMLAVVEPGVTLAALREEVEKYGLYYPVYPGEPTATLGGNVATNAGGMKAVRYGVTRNSVLGLEAVLANGDIITTGGKFVKCSTGYDLTQLITGSEGTLAVVTKIILKLAPKPAKRQVLFVPFDNLQSAIDCVPELLRLGMTPVGIEFMERAIVEIAEKYIERELPQHDHEAFLLIIMEGDSEEAILEYFASAEEICSQHGAAEAVVATSEQTISMLLEAREKFYPALSRLAPVELMDVVVPRKEIARFVARVKEISAKHGVPVIAYGHAGDGNVHLHPACINMSMEEWQRRLPAVMKDIYHAGVSLGGTISGEHGIGFVKKEYLPIQMDSTVLKTMIAIKRALDPNNILNPGKIVDV